MYTVLPLIARYIRLHEEGRAVHKLRRQIRVTIVRMRRACFVWNHFRRNPQTAHAHAGSKSSSVVWCIYLIPPSKIGNVSRAEDKRLEQHLPEHVTVGRFIGCRNVIKNHWLRRQSDHCCLAAAQKLALKVKSRWMLQARSQGHGWGGSSPNKVELNCCVLCIIQHYND